MPTGLTEGKLRNAAMVGILIDEALPALIDEHSLHKALGQEKNLCGEELVHVGNGATDRHTHARAVVIASGERHARADQRLRRVLAQHCRVTDEAARRQHYLFARTYHPQVSIDSGDHAMNGIGAPERSRSGSRHPPVAWRRRGSKTNALCNLLLLPRNFTR